MQCCQSEEMLDHNIISSFLATLPFRMDTFGSIFLCFLLRMIGSLVKGNGRKGTSRRIYSFSLSGLLGWPEITPSTGISSAMLLRFFNLSHLIFLCVDRECTDLRIGEASHQLPKLGNLACYGKNCSCD